MLKPPEKKDGVLRPSEPRPTPLWALFGVIFLVLVAAGGWLTYILTRPTSESKSVVTPTVIRVSTTRTAPPTLTIGSALLPTQPASQPLAYGVVISRILNLREAPGTDAAIIRSLKNGDIIELTRRSGGWYQTTDGTWVSALYLEVRRTRAEAESYTREMQGSG
jgi:hypothetical protein